MARARASKKGKGRMLDEVCAVTGWSRDNARQRLVVAVGGLAKTVWAKPEVMSVGISDHYLAPARVEDHGKH